MRRFGEYGENLSSLIWSRRSQFSEIPTYQVQEVR